MSWTTESAPSTTWTTDTQNALVQPETLYNDTNTYNVSTAGKGYYYNDRISGGAYSEQSVVSTTWTTV